MCAQAYLLSLCEVEGTAEPIAAIAISENEEYKVGPKLICSKVNDGISVMAGVLSGVYIRVNEKYPKASFIHCYTSKFNLVPSQKCLQDSVPCQLGYLLAFRSTERYSDFHHVFQQRTPLQTRLAGILCLTWVA